MSAATIATNALLTAALVALAAPAATQQVTDARIERRAAADPAAVVATLGGGRIWLAWTVPATKEGARTCCFRRGWNERGCTLDGRDQGWGTSSDWPRTGLTPDLVVLVELDRGRPLELRAVGAACPIDGAGRRLVALDGVAPEKSLDLLERWAAGREIDDDVRQSSLAAIGYHAAPGAAVRLERLALDRAMPVEVRKNALFWAGQTLGAAAVPIVDRFLAAADDGKLREHAYFVLAQAETPEALARLRRAAREDPSAHGRGQALFWLAQTDAPEAAGWILEAIAAESDRQAREQGVFALSQLDGGAVHLARLLRESPHADVRRQALFWLAQSDDPRALSEVERVLDP